jgi:rare lipoprotein A
MTRATSLALACAMAITATSAWGRGSTSLSGTASFYDEGLGAPLASGGRYQPKKFTCAHRTLPFGTRLRVTDRKTKRSVVVTVNDRGPFIKGRFLDLSLAAAKALDMVGRGVINVTATIARRPHEQRTIARRLHRQQKKAVVAASR